MKTPAGGGARRHDVDGLRAAALCAVVLYHAGFGAARGFFVGVDMFFVISGYFITGGLLRETERGAFRLGEFWLRRFWRIVPPAAAMAFACVVPAYFWSTPPDFMQFGKSLLSVLTFTSNHFFASQGGYFDAPLEMNPFLHTWFLSVQAQFYIVFPLIFLLTAWKFPKRILPVVAGLLAVSLAAGEFSARYFPTSAYYLLPSRFWELMTGSIAAVLSYRGIFRAGNLSAAPGEIASWLSVLAIGVCGLLYSPSTPFPGFAALPVCLGTAVLLVLPEMTARVPLAHRLLSLRPVVFVGTISYSVYLWHWPVFVYAKEYLLTPTLTRGQKIFCILLAFALGAVSWAVFERKSGSAKGFSALFRLAILVTPAGLAAVFLAVLLAGEGLPGRFPPEARAYIDVMAEARDAAAGNALPITTPGPAVAEMIRRGELRRFGGADAAPSFLAWGDSHANHFAPLFEKIAGETGAAGLFLPTLGRPPLVGSHRSLYDTGERQRAFREMTAAAVELVRGRGIPFVVLCCNWHAYARADLVFTDADGRESAGFAALRKALSATVAALEAAGAQVWIVRPVPTFPLPVPQVMIRAMRAGEADELRFPLADHAARNAEVDGILAGIARDHPAVRFIDPLPLLCPDGENCIVEAGGRPLYSDDNHLSVSGALHLAPAFAEFASSLKNSVMEN